MFKSLIIATTLIALSGCSSIQSDDTGDYEDYESVTTDISEEEILQIKDTDICFYKNETEEEQTIVETRIQTDCDAVENTVILEPVDVIMISGISILTNYIEEEIEQDKMKSVDNEDISYIKSHKKVYTPTLHYVGLFYDPTFKSCHLKDNVSNKATKAYSCSLY